MEHLRDERWWSLNHSIRENAIKFLSTSTHVYVDDYESGLNKKKNFIRLFNLYRVDLLCKIEWYYLSKSGWKLNSKMRRGKYILLMMTIVKIGVF